jgi:hypothetical protein
MERRHSYPERILEAVPGHRLVIIDTLFMFSPIQDTNKYSDTYAPVSAIQKIATETEVPIVLIHHTRKGAKGDTGEGWADEGMGSQGINGACDTIILLKKPDGKPEGTMRIKGRDVEEACYNVTFDKDICTWRITGDGEIVEVALTFKDEILELLRNNPEGLRNRDLCTLSGKDKSTVSRATAELIKAGKITKTNDLFELTVDNTLGGKTSTTVDNGVDVPTVEMPTVVDKSLPRGRSTDQQNQGLEIW